MFRKLSKILQKIIVKLLDWKTQLEIKQIKLKYKGKTNRPFEHNIKIINKTK